MNKLIMVIPDSHAMPGQDLSRYLAAGRLMVDRKPDAVVELGDFGDFESLCVHDGKGSVEASAFPKVLEDIKVCQEARKLLMKPLKSMTDYHLKVKKRSKSKMYQPRLVALEGNHEFRVARFLEKNPKFAHLVTPDITGALSNGWEWVPYNGNNPGIVEIDGILFAHYLTSGAMGQAISGKYAAATLVTKTHMSCVVGHDHRRRWHEERGIRTLSGLVAGCYFEDFMGYAGQANKEWWSGITLLHMSAPGEYDPEFISLERVKKEYL